MENCAQLQILPQTSPNHKTIHRHFPKMGAAEAPRQVLIELANELRDAGVKRHQCDLHLGKFSPDDEATSTYLSWNK